MKNGKINLRKLNDNEKDYKLLEKWYQEEEIYLHFEQKKLTYEEVKKKAIANETIKALYSGCPINAVLRNTAASNASSCSLFPKYPNTVCPDAVS